MRSMPVAGFPGCAARGHVQGRHDRPGEVDVGPVHYIDRERSPWPAPGRE